MKKTILGILILCAQISLAASNQGGSDVGSGDTSAKCPSDSTVIQTCVSSPDASDDVVAISMLDSVAVCQKGSQTILVFEKNGQPLEAPAELERRAGGDVIKFDADGTEFTVSYATAIRPGLSPNGRFTITFKNAGNRKSSSTLACQ